MRDILCVHLIKEMDIIWKEGIEYVYITDTNENLDPYTKAWLEENKHPLFGFPTLVRFSWGTCTPFFKDCIQVLW
jgi:hypothetical protein